MERIAEAAHIGNALTQRRPASAGAWDQAIDSGSVPTKLAWLLQSLTAVRALCSRTLYIIYIINPPEITRDELSYWKAKSCGGRERACLPPLIPRAIEGEMPARQKALTLRTSIGREELTTHNKKVSRHHLGKKKAPPKPYNRLINYLISISRTQKDMHQHSDQVSQQQRCRGWVGRENSCPII